jgi:anti-sigma regulatory factor (Ser/Thr protein kinase)
MIMRVNLPRDLAAARLARVWLEEKLAPLDVEPARLGTIELLVTELVTNVVEHTDSAPTLVVQADGARLLVQVEDGGGGMPQVAERDPERLGGWGLQIVDQLADSWGASYREDGTKVLWFELAVSA